MHESSYDTKTDHGAPEKQCVGILSLLSKQNELPQQELLLLASCSKHCHHFSFLSFFFSFEEVDGGPCVLHKHKIIEILSFHSAKWGAGRVVMADLAQTGCLICSWHPVLRNTSCRDGRKKTRSWSRWLSRKFQCNVEVCGIWAAAARRELWGVNAQGLYRILFTNLPPDPPPQTPPFSTQVKNDLLRH